MTTTTDPQVRHGLRLAAALPQIMMDDADERIASVYHETQQSLRVPFVNLIFRVLANVPDYLIPAWQALGPIVRSVAFEAAADQLRAHARLEHTPGALDIAIEDDDRLRGFNDTIHYVLPKLLLVATLLDRAGESRGAGGRDRAPGGNVGQFPVGVADDATKVELVDPDRASGRVGALFYSIKARHRHPLVSSYFRGLAQWPDVLEAIWRELEPFVGSGEYERRREDLIARATALAEALPPLALEGGPFDGEQGDDVRALLAAFRRKFIPEMLIDAVAIKAMLDGPESATVSRFSVAGGAGWGKKRTRSVQPS